MLPQKIRSFRSKAPGGCAKPRRSGLSRRAPFAHPTIGRQFLADAFLRMVPDLKYADTARRGYVAVSFTPTSVTGEFVFVSSVFENSYAAAVGPALQAQAGPTGRELKRV